MPKDITEIKQIRLIASDFNDVNSMERTRLQYRSNYCCPLANAFRRMGYNDINVGGFSATISGIIIIIDFNDTDLEKCRLSLVNGAKYAIVKVMN